MKAVLFVKLSCLPYAKLLGERIECVVIVRGRLSSTMSLRDLFGYGSQHANSYDAGNSFRPSCLSVRLSVL